MLRISKWTSLVVLALVLAGIACALNRADGSPPSIAAPTTRAATTGDGGGTELFELRIYSAAPGKMEALHKRFRDHTLKFFDKHGIRSVAYWSAVDDKHQDRLYY